ncbi:adenosylcobinamide-phosphate synthase CbiB [Silvibacterium acidisoli]|uniref:adenosylcobinamide-phosphate synthase CbiB n=1 Tax=Acidobacteriaceae bacterium ZG23-2 TaxID=2883246 RepID=UPI00406C38CD
MNRSRLILLAAMLDGVLGDPEWIPHPVRGIGWCIDRAEDLLYDADRGRRYQLLAGSALTIGVAAGAAFAASFFLRTMQSLNRQTGVAAEAMLASTCIASRNLYDEGSAVLSALGKGDLEHARIRLSRIVGRDTGALDASEISRALIETLAESACDGVVAPLFYLALGGVPLAICYKAINTMDSMIGHADERYFWFGKAAARLDDLANLLPSRITAALITILSCTFEKQAPGRALQIWSRDGGKHKSPNAGQPESAMAGALQVRLGGSNSYGGAIVESPRMGAEFAAPSPADARKALRLAAALSIAAAVFSVLIAKRRAR